MNRVDTHFHIWDLAANSYPWLQEGAPVVRVYGSSAPLRRSYVLEDFLGDCAGSTVTSAVYVQCGMRDPVDEALYVQRVHQENPTGLDLAIVGFADMTDPGASSVLERLAQVPMVRGIRTTVAWHADPILSFAPRPGILGEPDVRRAAASMAALGLRLDCMLYPAQMGELAELAAGCPDLSIIVNHTGMPLEADDDGQERWREGMHRLAGHPQITVKISGLGMLWPDWTDGRADGVIDETIDIFGEDRCMFGSNYPVERLASSYDAVFRAFDRAVAHRSPAARRKLFHDNAVRIYGL